jgi:hypothetical protein
MATYLSVAALRDRLRAAGIPVSGGNRDALVERGFANGVITEYERLATRDRAGSRRAWLEFELAKVGCTLRTDSKLCEAYIECGHGNPVNIANIMAEMKFYHTETKYARIRDAIYQNARDAFEDDLDEWDDTEYRHRDFRPVFHEYFDSGHASELAKEKAFAKWLQKWRSLEEASQRPCLPATLREKIYYDIACKKFKAWLVEAFPKKGSLFAQFALELANDFLRALHEACFSVSPTDFCDRFHAQIAHRAALDSAEMQARKRIDAFCSGVKGGASLSRALKGFSSSFLQTSSSGDQAELVKAVHATMYAEQETLKEASSLSSVLITFGDLARSRLTENPTWRDVAHLLDNDQRFRCTWSCDQCSYQGSALGLVQHCKARHNVQSVFDVAGVKTSNDYALAARKTYDEAILEFWRKDAAALVIQKRWRFVVACPSYLVCRRRLMRELEELQTTCL